MKCSETGWGIYEGIKRYSLYIILKNKADPIFAGSFYSLKELLETLLKFEKQADFESAFLMVEED
jgi:hypothetical protein